MARPSKPSNGLSFEGVQDLTRQEFKDECNIRSIMRRYETTGVLPMPGRSPPVARYGDFSNAPDFLEAQAIVLRASEQFNTLPVRVRDRFGYDPARFLAFVTDRNNLAEVRALGLLSEEGIARLDAAAAPPPVKEGEGK